MAPAFDPLRDLLDLTGKVAVVTGSTSGIGLATAAVLLRKGAKVYFAARNEEKAKGCIKRVEDEGLGPGNGKPEFLHLDLDNPREAKKSAEEFLKKEERLDILVNNAALLIKAYKIGFEGIQELMVVNYFSPFVFTQTLLPLLKKTETEHKSDVRIVNVSSDAIKFAPNGLHFKSKEDFNVEFKGRFMSSFIRYSATKLVDLLWSKELQRRLEADGSNIIVTAVHPGAILTENTIAEARKFSWPLSSLFIFVSRLVMHPPAHGAATLAFAAAAAPVRAEPETYRGAYLVPVGKVGKVTKAGEDAALAAEMWETTEGLVKEWGLA